MGTVFKYPNRKCLKTRQEPEVFWLIKPTALYKPASGYNSAVPSLTVLGLSIGIINKFSTVISKFKDQIQRPINSRGRGEKNQL